MPISIYPPILKSTQPAFLSNVTSYPVYFTLQKMTVKDEIKHIQIRVTKQSNNRSIVKTSIYPDGIIYKNVSFDNIDTVYNESSSPTYYVSVFSTDLEESWQPGFLYKIQMRFGKTSFPDNLNEFATWKQEQINNQTFSEWSTVMVIKAISEPSVYIQNAGVTRTDIVGSERTEISTTPLFTGVCDLDEDNKEAEDTYKFILYKGDRATIENQLEDSGWLQHNSNQNSVDYYRFNTVLTNDTEYTVAYQITTVNGYEAFAEDYTFLVNESMLSRLTGIVFEVDDKDVYCSENGCMNIYLTSEQNTVSGSYVITRSSEKTNFQVYEDIKFLTYSQIPFPTKTLIFQDFTIESGIKYKYAIQQENSSGLRTSPLYEEYSNERMVNFEYAFLYHDDVQLRLQFNNTMSTFKHTTLTSKQDTLGDKYPHLTKNGYAYYAEFPIAGLISLEMDSDQTFFIQGSDGYYYKDELVIPADKYIINDTDIIYSRDLTHDNIFIERIFREKAEEFLNDFDYKLYKSPTEGNIVVVLQNVSLTPKQELGRMIFEFSATAYEVLENTISNLNEYKIIDIGGFQALTTEDATKSFGQINGLFTGTKTLNAAGTRYVTTTPEELLSKIRAIEEVPIAGGYKTVVRKITALRIEQYPQVDFDAELIELRARRNNALNNGEDTTELEAEITKYENLQSFLSTVPETRNAILQINGKEIVMKMGRVYWLDDIDEDITSIRLKFTMPIIINYVCDLVQREDESVGVITAVDSSRIWGQISGIFTETHNILKNYNFKYQEGETYRVYNLYPDNTVKYGPYGDIILDNTTINLYKNKNLLDIIKEETKRQVEIMYGISNGFTNYDESTGQWDNGTIYYEFNEVYLFDIEASPGTIISIGKKADGSDKTQIVIGPTSRYILNPSEQLIEYVAIETEQFAIINYKCMTSQMTMSARGE